MKRLATIVTAASLATATMLAAGGVAAPAASAACITSLPVTFALPSPFAGGYGRTLPLRITTRGRPIRNLEAKLYTFGGDLLGRARAARTLTSSVRVPLRLRFALQPGTFTLALFGEPNAGASCGPKSLFRVVRFRDCLTELPVRFPRPPQGVASDYGETLSVPLAADGFLLRDVDVSLSTFDGAVLGHRVFPVVFGERQADFRLPGGLRAGTYTVFVRGTIASQPRSCGPKTTKTTLSFS